jgi:hypothetical protein
MEEEKKNNEASGNGEREAGEDLDVIMAEASLEGDADNLDEAMAEASINGTKWTRKRMLHWKTEYLVLVHPAVKRQKNSRFQRHECYMKQACEVRAGGVVKHMIPSLLETAPQIKARRRMLLRHLSWLEELARKVAEAEVPGDVPQLDVTPLLLQECEEALCIQTN